MKNYNEKSISIVSSILFFIILLCLIFSCTPVTEASAKTKESKPAFKKTISFLSVKQSTILSIKNMPKKSYVLFSSSNSKIAIIGKNTGKLIAKKAGKVTITAKIHNQIKKEMTALKMNIKVQPKDKILSNVRISAKQFINPWDYRVIIKSNRILLLDEISDSQLTLSKKGKKNVSLSAPFSSLSSDGKEITYTIKKDDAKKLCPHNGSMDGNYIISSDVFSGKSVIHYEERLGQEDISGFVLDVNGLPISNAKINYKTSKLTKKAVTDSTGHYKVKAVGTPTSITVSKNGYHTETLHSFSCSKSGTRCENFVLKPDSKSGITLDFHVLDENQNSIPDAEIYLLPDTSTNDTEKTSSGKTFLSSDVILSGATDTNGRISFCNRILTDTSSTKKKYTKVIVKDTLQFSIINDELQTAKKSVFFPDDFLEKNTYSLYIMKNSSKGETSYKPCQITFSPFSFYTKKISFDITLSKTQETLQTSDLLIHYNTEQADTINTIKSFHFSFYSTGQLKSSCQCRIFTNKNIENDKTIIDSIPVSLSDGIYYLLIAGENETLNRVFSSSLIKIDIKEGHILPVTISIKKISHARLLTYYAWEKPISQNMLFDIYQKTDNGYFYIETVSSSDFIKKAEDLYTADVLFSSLIENETYLFLPAVTTDNSSSCLYYTILTDNLYDTEMDAKNHPPFTQYNCSKTNQLPDDWNHASITILPDKSFTIAEKEIRNSSTYPNSVIATYQPDGTFINLTLLSKISQNSTLSGSSSTIIDIYTNDELLVTNQTSYRK